MNSRDDRVRVSVFVTLLFVLAGAGWAAQERETENKDGNKPPTASQVKGRGTKDRIPLWTDSSTIGDSIMLQNGSNVSVGGSVSATSFAGNGSGLTDVNATRLSGLLPSAFAQVGISNSFLGDQKIAGNLSLTGSLALPNTASPSVGVISFGGVPVVHIFSGIGNPNPPSNTFVGLNAGNFTMSGINNTAMGSATLLSNTDGTDNTALGTHSLFDNTSGNNNIAIGVIALESNSNGSSNTAIGTEALDMITSGNFNIAIGRGAGSSLRTGDNNIYVGSAVAPGPFLNESNTIRIGHLHTQTFIAGISGVTTGGPGAAVLVDSNGQLGTASSSRRFKYDIENMGAASSDILKLRPVTFRYKQAQDDGSHPLQYGLVAEEVAKVYPGLVQLDKAGDPQTVLYHVLPAMLLNELQNEHRQIQAQEKVIQSQQEQLKDQAERLKKLEAILFSEGN